MNNAGSRRRISIKDIAKALGISHATVSRALGDSPLVHPDTRKQIRAKANEMGYKASGPARSLVMQKTWTIGVVVARISDPFYGEIVSGIEEVARANKYSVFLADTPVDPAEEIRVVQSFAERRVDGILVTASRVGQAYLAMSTEMQIPMVLINNQHDGQFIGSVSINNVESACRAVEHLITLGHRRIAYLGDETGYESSKEREQGYRRALSAARIRIDRKLIVMGNGLPEGAVDPVLMLLSLPDPPTALFCYNDMSALGALRAAANRGINVPNDLSVVGFDDLFFAPFLDPKLTTIRQPRKEMGRRAMNLLLGRMKAEAVNQNIAVDGKLIVRDSTAPPRHGAAGLRRVIRTPGS